MHATKGKRGAAVQQYAIILGLIGVVALSATSLLGRSINSLYAKVGNTMSASANATIGATVSNGRLCGPTANGGGSCIFLSVQQFSSSDAGATFYSDTRCQAEADNNGLPPGTYRALLSTSSVNASARTPFSYPLREIDGALFEASNLWSGNAPEGSLTLKSDGTRYSSGQPLWTGTNSSGSWVPSCFGWTQAGSSITGEVGYAGATPGTNDWIDASNRGCHTSQPIICISQ